MRLTTVLVAPMLVASGLVVLPTVTAPIASAGCVKSSGITVCDDGSDTGPTVPYPCELDWYCYDGSTWDLGVDIDVSPGPPPERPDIGRPGRPDVGQPGRPGNRPGGGGGGGGGGGRR